MRPAEVRPQQTRATAWSAAWPGFGGSSSDTQIQAEQILATKRDLAELTAEQTDRTVEEIGRDGDRDRWFTAEGAREYGLIDRVITTPHELRG